jgi:hypothetical protein
MSQIQNLQDLTPSGYGGVKGWIEVTTTPYSMTSEYGYIANSSSKVELELPTNMDRGDVIRVVGRGSGGWKISQDGSQVIHFINKDTTTGLTGYLESTEQYDSVEILCIVDDTEFVVLSSTGNITIV